MGAPERARRAARSAGEIPDQLLLLEHPAVLTLGRQADESPRPGRRRPSLAARGIELIRVERGGEVTYHGPGQLVAYPIVRAVAARAAPPAARPRARGGAGRRPAPRSASTPAGATAIPAAGATRTGRDPRKIGALGLRVERGVSYHGIALNVTVDLADFELIDPCGMPGVVSTSIAARARATPADDAGRRRGAARRARGRIFARALAAAWRRAPGSPRGAA